MFIATYLSFYLLKSYFTAAQRLALCPFRGTGGRDWAPSRRSPGTRQRHFAGTSLEPRKLSDCPKGVRTLSLQAAVPPPHLHSICLANRAVPVWPRRTLP